MHICVNKLNIISSDNGLSPERRQAIIWSNAGVLLIGPVGTNFSEISIEIYIFSFKKMSSGNWQPFCLGINVFTSLSMPSKVLSPWNWVLECSYHFEIRQLACQISEPLKNSKCQSDAFNSFRDLMCDIEMVTCLMESHFVSWAKLDISIKKDFIEFQWFHPERMIEKNQIYISSTHKHMVEYYYP